MKRSDIEKAARLDRFLQELQAKRTALEVENEHCLLRLTFGNNQMPLRYFEAAKAAVKAELEIEITEVKKDLIEIGAKVDD